MFGILLSRHACDLYWGRRPTGKKKGFVTKRGKRDNHGNPLLSAKDPGIKVVARKPTPRKKKRQK